MKKYENFCNAFRNLKDIYEYEEPYSNVEMSGLVALYEICFEQKAMMQGGEYLISFGCTEFVRDELQVYHRLYDATYLTVLSQRNTIGYFDIKSPIFIPLNFI